MNKRYYRFRTLEKLLSPKYNELELQTIYFSPPESLNDPQEGYRDIFWKGDCSLWTNLFKNYITTLETVTFSWNLMGDLEEVDLERMDIFRTIDEYPTQEYQSLIQEIQRKFLKSESVIKLIGRLSERQLPVRRNEFETIIRLFQPYALQIIFDEYLSNNLTSFEASFHKGDDKELLDWINNHWFDSIEKITFSNDNEIELESIFQASNSVSEQLYLSNLSQFEFIDEEDSKKLNSLMNSINMIKNFSSVYIKKLEDLVHPKWYTACFMSDYENASVWGHYGDNHTGVCLIYQSDDNDCISIKRPVSSSSNGECSFEYKPSNLAKITYSDLANRSIDFFNSLGILPAHKARKHWFSSHEGEISSLINNFDTSEWRSEYWKKFYRDITLKNEDWSYEKEHRLILTSMLFDFSTVEKRCLKYDFKQLKGVIFGVKTPIIDKVRIIKIIERLCEEHGVDSFEFYQASYNVQTNKILKLPLGIFNIPKKDRRL